MTRPVRLETERLVLRMPTPSDAGAAGALLGDPVAMAFIGGVVPQEGWPAVVARWSDRWRANDMGPFVVERRADGAFLGRIGILVWDRRVWRQSSFAEAGEHAQPELGWALIRAEWGNGYATEAAAAVRDWARAERGVDSLVSVIAPANVASQRVALRLGAAPAETVALFDTGDAVVWRYPRLPGHTSTESVSIPSRDGDDACASGVRNCGEICRPDSR
jgi:RimJ/RimL family protein N-acetyltransferase